MNMKGAVLDIGRKVIVIGDEGNGFAEVASYPDADKRIEVSYFIQPGRSENRRVPVEALRVAHLPAQTRCYYKDGQGFRIGRVLVRVTTEQGVSYQVAFPNGNVLQLPETSFHVRSYVGDADPVVTLANLAHETPFLSDRRLGMADEVCATG